MALACASVSHAALAGERASPGEALASENEQIIRDAFRDWAEQGGPFTRILSPGIEWTVHGSSPYSRTYSGIESFIEEASKPVLSRLETPLIPDLRDIWAVDDEVIVRFDASANTISGSVYQNQYLWILTMEEGLVTRSEAFLDMAAYDALVASVPSAGE